VWLLPVSPEPPEPPPPPPELPPVALSPPEPESVPPVWVITVPSVLIFTLAPLTSAAVTLPSPLTVTFAACATRLVTVEPSGTVTVVPTAESTTYKLAISPFTCRLEFSPTTQTVLTLPSIMTLPLTVIRLLTEALSATYILTWLFTLSTITLAI